MSNSSQTTDGSTEHANGEPSVNGSTTNGKGSRKEWTERLLRGWWAMKEADTAVQIQKDMRRQSILERLMKKQQDGTVGKSTGESWPEWEDMNVANDTTTNNVHHHYPQPERRSGLLGPLLGAGLLAGPLLAWFLATRPATEDTDTDSAYVIDVRKEPVEP